MENNVTKINGVPGNETFWQKTKRKAATALNWGKTHWKGLALGAVAIGGGAYMLSRRGTDKGEPDHGVYPMGNGETVRDAINRVFDQDAGDGSDVGPDDDEPDDVDEY